MEGEEVVSHGWFSFLHMSTAQNSSQTVGHLLRRIDIDDWRIAGYRLNKHAFRPKAMLLRRRVSASAQPRPVSQARQVSQSGHYNRENMAR